ncbi:MAG: hypothetical protein AAFN78_04300 [Pseudomonadota bacterium]
MKTSLTVALASTIACLATAPLAFADSHTLLKDAGYETGLKGADGGWRLFGASQASSAHARQGKHSMLNGATSQSVAYPPYFVGMISGAYQEFDAKPGSRWRLTGYGMTPTAITGAPAFGLVQVSFFDAAGNDLGTVETVGEDAAKAKLSEEINNKTPVGEWVLLDTGIATAPAGAATVQAFTLFIDYSGASIFQGVYFDDLRLCEVRGEDASPEAPCD